MAENQEKAKECVEKGVPLLEERGYIEQDGDTLSITQEWRSVYAASAISVAKRTGKASLAVATNLNAYNPVFAEAILVKGPATDDEVFFMSVVMVALTRYGKLQVY